MTLRLRLVLGLLVLLTVGLAIFGFSTYALYSRSEYDRLDEQLVSSIPLVTAQLYQEAGLAGGPYPSPSRPSPGGGRPPPPTLVPPGTYGELRSADGTILAEVTNGNSTSTPDLAPDLTAPATGSDLFTTDSSSGSGTWRAAVTASGRADTNVVVVAIPMNEVASSLQRLVIIELVAAGVLLALLAVGSWLLLRRGLRPLEHMATSARTITSGDLSQRVEPADDRTEVGQLGLALNTMLGSLEASFAEREATEQRLRQFLADASHELRTPLTSIQGFAELAQMRGDDPRIDLDVVFRRIGQESVRMKTLVDDLLLLAQLDRTRPTERSEVDLAVLAADACSDTKAVAPDRRVILDAPAPLIVLGDRDHLRQAIANLASNAVRHTPSGTPIEVSARRDQGDAVVTIRDHGEGLPPEALDHAFDRFWQADPARVGSGAGLGLAIVAGIAKEHGGAARASNAEGGGALFTLRLPLGRLPVGRLPADRRDRGRADAAPGQLDGDVRS